MRTYKLFGQYKGMKKFQRTTKDSELASDWFKDTDKGELWLCGTKPSRKICLINKK